MGIKIEISRDSFGNNVEIFNRSKIKDGVDIKISDNEFADKVKMFNDVELGEVVDELQRKMEMMPKDSSEYRGLLRITEMEHSGKDIRGQIISHIGMFANGVLQNVVAHMITG